LIEVRADAGLPAGALAKLVDVKVSEASPGEYSIAGALDSAGIARVLGWFADQGAHVTAVNSRRRTLEDVYLALTNTTALR
jgi:ABC-2 type transport system ATP-binding protein